MTASRIVIICEGPEDLAALRELLIRQWGFEPKRSWPPPAGEIRLQPMARGEVDLDVRAAGSRSHLISHWPTFIRTSSESNTVRTLGLSFDPNGDAEQRWRRTVFEDPWGSPPMQRDGEDYLACRAEGPQGPMVRVVPLPWSSSAPDFDKLDATTDGVPKQCLERLLVAAANARDAQRGAMIARWLDELQQDAGVSWKTAARLWHAVLFPEVGVADMATKAFGQDADLWSYLAPLLEASSLWSGLERMLGPAPSASAQRREPESPERR